MKTIEIIMYLLSILLNIGTIVMSLLAISQGSQFVFGSIYFQIIFTVGAVGLTFTALLISLVRKYKGN
ncbi:hypothetical protein JR338_05720 [Chloroflexota bacterium]|nr:hypothetical protein JR338_05720 [Chloroflexota bacterium]